MTGQDKQTTNQADLLVNSCARDELEVELFQDELGDAYARVFFGPGYRILKLQSRGFKRWLARRFWGEHTKAPNAESMASALAVLEGEAIYRGHQYSLCNRVAQLNNAIYYDLSNENGAAVLVSKAGWQVTDPPVLFRSYSHQKAQVKPAARGRTKQLLEFMNVKDENQAILLLVYVVAAFIPDIPRPILHLYGEKGSAKTTLFRLLKSLIDPSRLQTLSLTGGEAELVQKLSHHHFPCFDNVSYLPTRISDCLCRAVTGEGHSKRELYSDDEDVIYSFKRCIGINGINVAARRPDLLDRCLLIELDRISPKKRKEESQLWHEFEQAKPEILAGIFETLSCAMAIFPQVKPATLYRMADFTRWGCAIARSLGYGEATFLTAYGQNLAKQNSEALAGSNVATAILSFMDDRETWQGSASQLLSELEIVADILKINIKAKGWPQAPNTLSRRLNEIKSNLAGAGIEMNHEKDTAGLRGRVISFKKRPKDTVATVASEQNGAIACDKNCGDISDDTDSEPSIQARIPSQDPLCDDTANDQKAVQSQIPSQSLSSLEPTQSRCDDSDDTLLPPRKEDPCFPKVDCTFN